jgi:hypothetical protein
MDQQTLKSMTFVMACNSHFGRKAGQSLQDFNAELKALTPKDREDMIAMFREIGIDATKQSVGA